MLTNLLNLTRTLAILDVETTGQSSSQDRICQIAVTWVFPSEKAPIVWESLINPTVPITNTINGKHGITDDMVKDQPTFQPLAAELAKRLTDVDIGGYGVTFDVEFLREEFNRAGVLWTWDGYLIDPMKIYYLKEKRDLTNAYKRYVDDLGLANAHDAASDVAATIAVLMGQLKEYTDIPRTIPELSAICFPPILNAVDRTGKIIWVEKEAAIGFGKHKGRWLRDVPSGYLEWILDNNFPADTKEIIRGALQGNYPMPRQEFP